MTLSNLGKHGIGSFVCSPRIRQMQRFDGDGNVVQQRPQHAVAERQKVLRHLGWQEHGYAFQLVQLVCDPFLELGVDFNTRVANPGNIGLHARHNA